MKMNAYLKDKIYAIVATFITLIIIYLILMAFKINTEIIIPVLVIFLICNLTILGVLMF